MTKLIYLRVLLDAVSRLSNAVAAIASDDFDAAEVEMTEVHRILVETADELRAA